MGKKKRKSNNRSSRNDRRFVQEQRFQEHQDNKYANSKLRRVRQFQRVQDDAKKEYTEGIQEEFNNLFEVNNIESPEFNINSKLALYKILEKKIKSSLESFKERMSNAKEEDLNRDQCENVISGYENLLNNINSLYDLRFLKLENIDYILYENISDEDESMIFTRLQKVDKELSDYVTKDEIKEKGCSYTSLDSDIASKVFALLDNNKDNVCNFFLIYTDFLELRVKKDDYIKYYLFVDNFNKLLNSIIIDEESEGVSNDSFLKITRKNILEILE